MSSSQQDELMLGMSSDLRHFDRAEMLQAFTNASAMPLELFSMDVTPTDSHYVLSHFGVPQCAIDAHCSPAKGDDWMLTVAHHRQGKTNFTVGQIRNDERLERVSAAVTLECAGNGRALMKPRKKSVSWMGGGVSTSRWSGVRLSDVLEIVCNLTDAECIEQCGDIVFTGADAGVEFGSLMRGNFQPTPYQFSLTADQCFGGDRKSLVMLAFAMNDDDHIALRHGFPLRLIVPGVYGMASVKYLRSIELRSPDAAPFRGWQKQVYRLFREVPVGVQDPDTLARIVAESSPVHDIIVKSALAPPGVAVDLHAVKRHVLLADDRHIELHGQAWAGSRHIVAVHVSIANTDTDTDDDDKELTWLEAIVNRSVDAPYAWSSFYFHWRDVAPGQYVVRVRAQDDEGNVQPHTAKWNYGGYCNHSIEKTIVVVH